jgi:hypothetical protein
MPETALPIPPPNLAEDPEAKALQLGNMALRLMRTIGIARALVRSGRTLDLRGIEDGIGLLCAQILDLPTRQGRTLLCQLQDLLAEVDALAVALSEAHANDLAIGHGG